LNIGSGRIEFNQTPGILPLDGAEGREIVFSAPIDERMTFRVS
jgi:hypothetical protein